MGKEKAPMRIVSKPMIAWVLLGMVLAVSSILNTPRAAAVEVGEPAPDFKLPSTNGVDIGLGDFKGKKWVFLEFYAADFSPT
jgi:peroxiredoxin Q/BCP